MATCIKCCGASFSLDRVSGNMTCNSCGAQNYVGSPECYGPSEFEFNKKTGEVDRTELMTNSIFKGTKE